MPKKILAVKSQEDLDELENQISTTLLADPPKKIYQWVITEPPNSTISAGNIPFNEDSIFALSGTLSYILGEGLFAYFQADPMVTPDFYNTYPVVSGGGGYLRRITNEFGTPSDISSANLNTPTAPIGSVYYVQDLLRFYGKTGLNTSMPLQTLITVGTHGQYPTIHEAISAVLGVGTYTKVVIEVISDITETVQTTFVNYFELTIVCNVGHTITWNDVGLKWSTPGGKCFFLGNFNVVVNLDTLSEFIYAADVGAPFELDINCNTSFTSISALGYLILAASPQSNVKISGGTHSLNTEYSMLVQSSNFRFLNSVLLVSESDGQIFDVSFNILLDSVVFVVLGDVPSSAQIISSSDVCQMSNILIVPGGIDLTGRSIIIQANKILADTIHNQAPIVFELSSNGLELTQSIGITINYKTSVPGDNKCLVSNSEIFEVLEIGTLTMAQYSNCIMPIQQYGLNNYAYVFTGCSFKGTCLFNGDNNIITSCYNQTGTFNIIGNNSILSFNQTFSPITDFGAGNIVTDNIVI